MEQSLFARAVESAGGPEAFINLHGPEAVEFLLGTWSARARPQQLLPAIDGLWSIWLLLAGRGFGKTACLGGGTHDLIEAGYGRLAIIGPTAADVRDTIIEGDSGILRWTPPNRQRPVYEPSKRKVTFWNGATALCFSAEEPDRLRGPQFDGAICDELAAWSYLQETWDMLQFGLRLGRNPIALIATTPRPLPLLKALVRDPRTRVVRGSTFDNSTNLAPAYLDTVRRLYEGTRLGRQELHAEILDDNPAALWQLPRIDELRRPHPDTFRRVVVGVDPAVSHDEKSDETGIVAVGAAMCGCKGRPEMHAFVLDDASGIHTPGEWATRVIRVYESRKADRVIAEINNGGALVEANLRANGGAALPYKGVHAAQGKRTRAEPISALYEQGKVHHCGSFAKLEDQMCQWNPMTDDRSPDRMDALVWALTELMIGPAVATYESAPVALMPRRC